MNVLITGIAGFIGSALADWHIKSGDTVYGMDKNFYWLKNRHEMKVNLADDFGKILTSISKRPDFSDVIFNNKIDIVYHCAAIVGVHNFSDGNEKESYLNNSAIDRNVLNLLNFMPDAKVAYMSSSEVYGAECKEPFKESDTPRMLTSSRGLYSAEKYCMEQMLKLLPNKTYIFRLFNVCGYGQKESQGFISKLVYIAHTTSRKGESINIHKNGVRCYCHISDAVQMMTDILASNTRGIFNIGNPALKLSNIDVFNAFVKFFDLSPEKIKMELIENDEIGTRIPDISKALKYTKAPEITLNDIFKEFQENMKYY